MEHFWSFQQTEKGTGEIAHRFLNSHLYMLLSVTFHCIKQVNGLIQVQVGSQVQFQVSGTSVCACVCVRVCVCVCVSCSVVSDSL